MTDSTQEQGTNRSERRRQRRKKIKEYIDAHHKSPFVGSLYALVFGPLGCLYTFPKNAVFGLLAAAAVGLIYWPLIGLVWLGCVVAAPFQVRDYNRRIRRGARHYVL